MQELFEYNVEVTIGNDEGVLECIRENDWDADDFRDYMHEIIMESDMADWLIWTMLERMSDKRIEELIAEVKSYE